MVKVEKGQVYSAAEAKSGDSQKGKWWFCPVKAEKGYDRILLWAANPDEVEGAAAVKIEEVTEVTISNRKSNEKWYTSYNVTAKLSKAAQKESEFVNVPDDLSDIFGMM